MISYNKTIAFRVDANEYIATGHLMRCISIATQCIKKGAKCIFLLSENKETMRLKSAKIPYYILNTDWKDKKSEINLLCKVLSEIKADMIVIDSYEVTRDYLESIDKKIPVMYIDDEEKDVYDITALLHYGQWEDDTHYTEKYSQGRCHLLTGMKYIPLREEFLPEEKENTKKRRSSIMITTGGTDPFNITLKVLEKLKDEEEFREYDLDVIVGTMNCDVNKLQSWALENTRIHLHKNVKNMSKYMRQCQYAISAGGTTLFELCACKIPTVCFSFADNQQKFVEEVDEREVMMSAGDARFVEQIEGTIIKKLKVLKNNSTLRSQYAGRMGNLVDGLGSRRIAEYLINEVIKK